MACKVSLPLSHMPPLIDLTEEEHIMSLQCRSWGAEVCWLSEGWGSSRGYRMRGVSVLGPGLASPVKFAWLCTVFSLS